jgi:DNA replication and repair protein RecF
MSTRFSSLMELSLQLSPDGRWDFFFNGKKTSAQKLRSKTAVVSISPDDHSLIRGQPDERRQFLDDVFSDLCPGYVEIYSRFEEVIHSRNRILKHEQISWDDREMNTWTRLLVEAAYDLYLLRLEMWPQWVLQLKSTAPQVLGSWAQSFDVKFTYDQPHKPESFKAAYFNELRQGFDTDRATGWTHRGPHRDDFQILIDGLDSKQGASQGQARMLALHQKWTYAHWIQAEIGEEPILIVDDLSSELDALRRSGILSLVSALKTQIFISTTDASLVDTSGFSEYTFFDVSQGQIRPRKPQESQANWSFLNVRQAPSSSG